MAKNRFLDTVVALSLVLCVSSVLSEEIVSTTSTDASSLQEEPVRAIAIRVVQPRIFGGVMIRGHCGHMLMAHSFPVVAHVTVREMPADDSYPDPSEDGAPWSHGEADGVAKSLESFFALSHPLALFREDPALLDKWHQARMRALEAIHSQMLRHAFPGAGDSQDSEQSIDGAYPAEVGADASELIQGPVLSAKGLTEDSSAVVPQEVSTVEPGTLETIEWTPLNTAGIVLLGLGFGLLVAMLLMSLSTLIYGCSEPEAEPLIYVEDSVETPLLKTAEVDAVEEPANLKPAQPEGMSVMNPLNSYEPPKN